MKYVYNTTDQKKINKKRKKQKKQNKKQTRKKKNAEKQKTNRLCIDIFAFIHYVYCCYYLAKLFYSLSGG
jgi:sugar phosphate permease